LTIEVASITKEGRALLTSLDKPVQASVRATLAHVPEERLRTLVEILEEVRTVSTD
jgi:hypothetical protein